MSESQPPPEATPVPPVSGRSVGADPLAVGVEALRRGEDPIPGALEALRVSAGARRAVWIPGRVDAPAAVGEEGRTPRRGELPASLPRRWLGSIEPGEVRWIGNGELAREPRARADALSEALLLRTSLGTLWLDASGRLQLDPTGEVPELLALDHLEELSRLEADRERERSLARQGERAAAVAHDLRNQLSLALLESRRMREDGETGVGEGEGLDRALETARRLCEDFLLSDGGGRRDAVAIREVLEDEGLATAKISGRNGEVAIAVRCPASLERVIDEALLRRIVRNLLLNAIAASHRGGRVQVEASGTDGGGLELVVTDEGRGMDRDELERMLRPGETRGGTGYGTSSVLEAIAELDGELEVESEVGEGTRARVRLG